MKRFVLTGLSAVGAKHFFVLLLFPVLVHGQVPARLEKQIQEFDQYVENARKEWLVPGLAIAVVKDNQVIFQKGYGARIDAQTLFPCASTTKAMTATCMAMLVDEGKVKWTDPVIKHLPDFQLYDPFVTRELQIRDLFIHDSGLGNADFLWISMHIPPAEIVKKLSMIKPAYSFRSNFIYQNLLYVVAGQVIEKVSGLPWEIFIRKRIFEPLAMRRTYSQQKDVADSNQAKPFMVVDNTMMVIEQTNADAIGPAGSVWSCAEDMGKWVMCMLDSSKYPGGKLLKAGSWMELFKPQIIVPPGEFYPTLKITKPNWMTYGLGWFQHDYKGKKVNFHTGSLAGSVALHTQMPEEKIGLFIFANLDHVEVRHALMYKAFDIFALGGNRDWSAEFKKLYDGINQRNEKPRADFEANRVPNTKPSLLLSDYAGKYSSPLYGEMEVTVVEKDLVVQLNHYVKATLVHWHYDTFYGSYQRTWYGKAKAVFGLNALGNVDRINFDGMEFKRD